MLPARTAPRAAVEQVQVYVSYVWVVWQIPEALAKELEEALSGYVWCKNRSHKFLHLGPKRVNTVFVRQVDARS